MHFILYRGAKAIDEDRGGRNDFCLTINSTF
jgi:hypothetical protein